MAGKKEILEEMQAEITCAICRSYFSEPVTIDCGHTFCRACLSSTRTARATDLPCPECRQVFQGRKLPGVHNNLAQLTDLTLQLSSEILKSTEGHSHCATHKDVFKLFCEDDQTPLCLRCSQSPEHETHKHSPVEEAAHNYRENFQHIGNQLGKHIEETEKLVGKGKRLLGNWHSMISEEYFRLRCFLLEEEKGYLKEILEEQRAKQGRITQHIQTLQKLMLDVQQALYQPNVPLLQGVKQLLVRSQSTLSQSPKPVTQELRDYPISGMIEMLQHFRVDMRINSISAPPSVTFSGDMKSVKAGEGWLVDNEDPDASDSYFVFADQSFISGTQYWEVDVTQLPQWILGIYTPPLEITRHGTINPIDSIFLLKCVKKKDDYFLKTYPTLLNHRMKVHVPRVGVYLEHVSGTLVFYNVVQSSIICRFDNFSFTVPVTPIFCPGPPLPGTEPGPMTICAVDSHLCPCCYSSL